MNDPTLPLTGLSSVRSKSVVARFDGGMLSSNGGVLALAEVEKRLRVAERLAWCIDDPRCADQVVHSLADMIGFRMKMIAAGYEDGNDANRLRSDPVFKMAQDALPSGREGHLTHRPQSHPAARDINDGAQTPPNEPADRNLQTPTSITTDYPPALTRLVKKHPNSHYIAASSRQKLVAVHQGG